MSRLKLFTTGLLSAGASWLVLNQVPLTKSEKGGSYIPDSDSDPVDYAPVIAVIGSGIGGSTAAYHLRKIYGPSSQIDVFEKADQVGGRMAVINMNGKQIEAGGTIIHDSNKYMADFTTKFGFEKFKAMDDDDTLGIYDGKQFLFTESSFGFVTKLKMIWRYGLFSLWHLNKSLVDMLTSFQTIYSIQDEGKAFKTVPDLLRAIGGDEFVEYTQRTTEDVMLEKGINELTIHELVTIANRCNYGQDAMVNAFTGYVSMAGTQEGDLFSVKGGNYQVCEQLLKHANATVFHYRVTDIRKDTLNGKTVYYLNGVDGHHQTGTPYDAVVVAAPLEVPDCYFKCDKCIAWPSQKSLGQYQQTIASFVQAYINFKHFGFEKPEDMPTSIFTIENKSLRFSTLAPQRTTDGELVEDPPIYKVFSREKLTNKTLKELFIINEDTKYTAVSWLAYPHYTPPEKFTPFVLDDGVFYVNAIERAASAMEMSAIGGRNAALLVKQYLKERDEM